MIKSKLSGVHLCWAFYSIDNLSVCSASYQLGFDLS
ncbi:Uncharacterised protein [Vibrio cholerae]|nr:Uncharacterised protein [Vibrio cholerae]CSC90735.1 Uncharacterised protein [Vibrio cholerae]CSI55562.1 Uncharacterised protein [Vibrio cholerae]